MVSKVLLNALHTTTGGGLVYLQNILPYLAADKRFELTLLMPEAGLRKITVPENVRVWRAPVLGFAAGHLWEQAVLPFKACGFAAMWCNANYVPVLARKPIPTIHTTPRAAAQALSFGMKVYWFGVKALTRVSLLRAPAALSVAHHVIADYACPRMARKVRVASPATIVSSEKIRKTPGVIVAVGDYYPQKNYPELLHAVQELHARLPQVRLEIIGRPVDPAVARQVKNTIHKLQLGNVVSEIGALPHADLLARLASASVFVSLSRAECFNMPVLEALGMGTPVVAGDSDFQREVAGDAAVYVPLDRGGNISHAVAEALQGILMNPPLAAAMAKRGRARAAKFDWEKTSHIIADTLNNVLAKH